MVGRWWSFLFLVVALTGCSDAPSEATEEVADSGMIEGVVVTQAIVPILGASVSVQGTEWTNTTDGDGAFRMGPLPLGTYRLFVQADGYADTVSTIQVGRQSSHVNIVLDAVRTDVPYHELLHLNAFIECSYAQRVAGVIGGNFNCLGITDLLLGIKIDNDQATFPVPVSGGGFQGMLVEMVWEPQQTMEHFSAMLRDPVDAGGGVGLDRQYWSGVSEPPLVARVLAGVQNDGAYEGDVFHPDADADHVYEFIIAGMSDTSQPVDVAVALQQELDVFLSLFYHALPGDDYGILT